jgi:hypothetical protein
MMSVPHSSLNIHLAQLYETLRIRIAELCRPLDSRQQHELLHWEFGITR